ncbi:hypothetical protein REPUB_Repub10bG0048300 [Reevesia pubescens]
MDKEVTSMIKKIMALEASRATNAHHSARGGAARPNTTSPACSSVRNAARNACVFLQGIMATKLCALATTTGRPRKEDPSALKLSRIFSPIFLPFISYFPTLNIQFLVSEMSRILYPLCHSMRVTYIPL